MLAERNKLDTVYPQSYEEVRYGRNGFKTEKFCVLLKEHAKYWGSQRMEEIPPRTALVASHNKKVVFLFISMYYFILLETSFFNPGII